MISSVTATHMGGNAWRIAWESDGNGPFWVYDLSGGRALASATAETAVTILLEADEEIVVEVRESAYSPVPRGHPGRLTLYWRCVSGTDYYRIDEYVGAVWTERARVSEDGRSGYTWRTRQLEDVTTHQFRAVPVGTNGNAGTAAAFTTLMVRYPDAPSVAYSYDDEAYTVTITAA